MKIHMNLQLFAQPANHTGATGMSAEMKTYYEKRLLDQAEPLLVHDQFGDKYPIPANNGKTIEFRKYESLPKATEPLTEGVTPNAQALTVTPMTATVKQYGGWAAITDVLQLTAIDNNITQATKVLASQAGCTLDTVTREVLAGGTNVIYAPAGDTAVTSRTNLTTASVLTPDLIDQAATALKAQNADAIGESYVAYDLRRNPEWIDVHKYSTPENIYNGEIGKLAGVRFIETSEAKIWTGDGCPTSLAVFGTLVLAAHAYAVTEVEGGGLQHKLYGTKPSDYQKPKDLTNLAAYHLEQIEKMGFFAHFYTYTSYANVHLDMTRLAGRWDIWLADYTGKTPKVSFKYNAHQHSSEGSVPGITGNVDLNVTTLNYPKIIRKKGLTRLREGA